MMKVLLLKSPKDDDPYLKILGDNGYETKCLPVLSFEYINLDSLGESLRQAEHFSSLILTSQNAVEACKRVISLEEGALSQWRAKKNFVVGEATYKLAKELLSLDCIGSHTGSADTLSHYIISELDVTRHKCRVLYPKTSLKTDLKPKLEEAGCEVTEVEVYNTIPNPSLETAIKSYVEAQGAPDVCVFFSPSGVDFSLQKLKDLLKSLPHVIAVGKSTSKALTSSGVADHLVMESPTPQSLCDCLKKIQ